MTYQGQTGTTGTGTDPAYVPDREVFDAYTHQQIWDLARERLAPAELRRVADAWGRAADALESAFDEHARELTRLSGEWSGIAAAAAAQAATALVQAGDDTVEVCRALRHLMTANSDAAESVRAAIPPPPEPYRPDPDSAVEAATGAQRRTTYNLAAAAATATAQDAMTFGYNPTIPASGDNVRRFPALVATAPEGPGISPISSRGPAPAPSTGPGTAVGADPETSENGRQGSTTSNIDGDTTPVTPPGRAGDGSSPGNASAPTRTAPDNESQLAGTPSDPSPEAGSSADAPEPASESPQPDNTPAPNPPQHRDARAADTVPAAAPAPDTQHARPEPTAQPSSAQVDRGTGPAAGPGVTDLSPRSPASPPTTGAGAPIPPAPSAAAPIPAGPSPAGPAPAGPVSPTPPGATGGAAAGHSNSTGGTSGPGHAPGTNTPQHRPAPGIQPNLTGGPGAAPGIPATSAPSGTSSTSGTPPAYAPGAPAPASGTPATTGNDGSLDGAGNTVSAGQTPACWGESESPSCAGPGSPASDGSLSVTSTSPEGATPSGSGSAGSTRVGVPSPGWTDSPSRTDFGSPPDTESEPGAPGSSQNQACTAPGTSGPDAPAVRAPTTSGSTATPGPAAVPYSPDPSVRPPAGHADPVVNPPLPGEREALGPAGTGPNGSTAEAHEHPGQRPVRLVPTGMPLPSTAGAPPTRPADAGRTSPDYLHAPNEELTATDPKVPPVLGEYTETERAERGDPGGGSR